MEVVMNKTQITVLVIFIAALALAAFMFWRVEKSVAPSEPTSTSTFKGPTAGSIPYVKGPTGLPPK